MSGDQLKPKQRDAIAPDASCWVAASAGTGKTKVLVSRLLRLLLEGNAPNRILCITYTKAAAAEIIERLQHITRQWSIMPEADLRLIVSDLAGRSADNNDMRRARRLFPLILQTPGGMRIMTIHAFCQSVLMRFPLEAQIPPTFDIASERQTADLLDRAKRQVLFEARQHNNTELHDALHLFMDRLSDQEQNDFLTSLFQKRFYLHQLQERFTDTTAYREHLLQIFSLHEAETAEVLQQDFIAETDLESLRSVIATMLGSSAKTTQARGEELAAWASKPKDYEIYADWYMTNDGTPRSNIAIGLKNAPTSVIDFLQTEQTRVIAYRNRRAALEMVGTTHALYILTTRILHLYHQFKLEQNILDYEDQILLTASLLKEKSDSAWVLYKLDGGLDHILLDEAQDTSPAQWEIVEALAEEFYNGKGIKESGERTLFVVGDEKQSIFSFQNAEPQAFNAMHHTLRAKAKNAQVKWHDIDLVENFRSAPLVLELVDLVFSNPSLASQISHNPYLPHQPHKIDLPAHIELWPLLPKANDNHTKQAEQPPYVLAEAIATRVATMLQQDPSLRPGDFMLLVRKRNPMVAPLLKAFKDFNLPVSSPDQSLLTQHLAVQDCLAMLQASLSPCDDYTFSCVLKSPFIGFNEEQLFHLCTHNKETSLFEKMQNLYPEIFNYLSMLKASLNQDNLLTFFYGLLDKPCPNDDKSARHALIKRLGFDTSNILNDFLQVVSDYQKEETAHPQHFLTWLQHHDLKLKKQAHETDFSSVRIMTVHGAKGLQAKIVFLVDANGKPSPYKWNKNVLWMSDLADGYLWNASSLEHPILEAEKDQYHARQFAEYYRLLYVALTRAEQQLLICGWEQKKSFAHYPSWYEAVTPAVTALAQNHPALSGHNNHAHGSTIVVQNMPKAETHDAYNQATKAVLKIPHYLQEKPAEQPIKTRPLRPSRPQNAMVAVTSPLETPVSRRYERGSLLHNLLQISADAHADQQEKILHAALQRQPNLTNSERETLFNEVWSVLRNPDFSALFTPYARTEVPLIGEVTIDGQHVAVSAQIDRLLIEPSRVLIVDYKTNRPPVFTQDAVAPEYLFQMRVYKTLLEQIYPGREVQTALLWTAVPYLLPLSL